MWSKRTGFSRNEVPSWPLAVAVDLFVFHNGKCILIAGGSAEPRISIILVMEALTQNLLLVAVMVPGIMVMVVVLLIMVVVELVLRRWSLWFRYWKQRDNGDLQVVEMEVVLATRSGRFRRRRRFIPRRWRWRRFSLVVAAEYTIGGGGGDPIILVPTFHSKLYAGDGR